MPGIFVLYGGTLSSHARRELLLTLVAAHQERVIAPVGPRPGGTTEIHVDDVCGLACSHLGVYMDKCLARERNDGGRVAVLYGNPYRHDTGPASGLVSPKDLLSLHNEDPTGFPSRLAGAYIVAIWDPMRDELILANDRVGCLQHYVARVPDELFALAPDASSLTLVPGVTRQISAHSVAEFLSLGYVMDRETLLANVTVLLGGQHWRISRRHRAEQRTYFQYQWRPQRRQLGADDWGTRLVETLRGAVAACAPRKGRAIVALSGGLDSGFVAFLSTDSGLRPSALTVGRAGTCEVSFATQVAERLGIDITVVPPNLAGLCGAILWGCSCVSGLADPGDLVNSMHVLSAIPPDAGVLLKGLLGNALASTYVMPSHFVLQGALTAHDIYRVSHSLSPQLVATALAELNGADVATMLERRIGAVLEKATGDGPVGHLLWFFIHQLSPKKSLYGSMVLQGHVEPRSPFWLHPVPEIFLAAPLRGLFAERWYRRALVKSWPQGRHIPSHLADLPPATPTWRLILRCLGRKGRLPAPLQRAWACVVWDPDHPSHRHMELGEIMPLLLEPAEAILFRDEAPAAPHLDASGVRKLFRHLREGRGEVGPLVLRLMGYAYWYQSLP